MTTLAEKIRRIRREAPAKREQFLKVIDSLIIKSIEEGMEKHFGNGTRDPYTWRYSPEDISEDLRTFSIDGAPTDPHSESEYNVLRKRIREYFCAPDYIMYSQVTPKMLWNSEPVYPIATIWEFDIVDDPEH
jgi:hypothetical protein